MIVRMWRGYATPRNAEAYARHLEEAVFPKLRGIAGHQGGSLLRREADGRVEFLVLTMWESMEAVPSPRWAPPPLGANAVTAFGLVYTLLMWGLTMQIVRSAQGAAVVGVCVVCGVEVLKRRYRSGGSPRNRE